MKKFFATGGLIGLAIVGAVMLAVGAAGAKVASYELRPLAEALTRWCSMCQPSSTKVHLFQQPKGLHASIPTEADSP